MISKSKPKNLAKAKIVELRKGIPIQQLNGKYLVDLKEKRWQTMLILTMFKLIVRKFDVMNDFDLNRQFDYIMMGTTSQDEIVKYINKYIGKYVTFYTGNGKTFDYSPDNKKIVMPGVEDKRNEVEDSASTLESNLKKLAN
tara:strand:+ start:161 stop:583 length:423 start_codon:yes stop_codon:yes gene_type:complete